MSDPRHGNRPKQPAAGPRAGAPVNPATRQPLSSGAEFAGVGLQMGAAIGFFALAGYWLDKWLGTSPWLLIGMVFLGAGAAFYAIYQRVIGKGSGRGRGRGRGTRSSR